MLNITMQPLLKFIIVSFLITFCAHKISIAHYTKSDKSTISSKNKITSVYSLLNLFEHHNKIDFMSQYKIAGDKENLIYINSLNELEKILKIKFQA